MGSGADSYTTQLLHRSSVSIIRPHPFHTETTYSRSRSYLNHLSYSWPQKLDTAPSGHIRFLVCAKALCRQPTAAARSVRLVARAEPTQLRKCRRAIQSPTVECLSSRVRCLQAIGVVEYARVGYLLHLTAQHRDFRRRTGHELFLGVKVNMFQTYNCLVDRAARESSAICQKFPGQWCFVSGVVSSFSVDGTATRPFCISLN